MGRKPNNTSTVVDQTVEVNEENQEVVTEKNQETTKAEKKPKEIKDDDDVIIVCAALAGKSVIGTNPEPIKFDEEGKATVKGIDAKRFLTIPGYSLGK